MRAAFTIATANYLAQAKTLADSFILYNPEFKFYIILLDKIETRFDVGFFDSAVLIEIEQLKLPPFLEMVDRYSVFELSNALKPFVAEYFFGLPEKITSLLYFDSDICIYGSFSDIDVLLSNHSIILTPHVTTPMPLDGLLINEQTLLNSGIYNGGFFALSNSDETGKFIQWWKDRLINNCFIDFAKGLFVDQIWLNFVPLYFPGHLILKETGFNVAFWNLYERNLTEYNKKYLVNQTDKLIFFHFSGYDFSAPHYISKYQTRHFFEELPMVKLLFQDYHGHVMGNRFEFFSKLECLYKKQVSLTQNEAPDKNKSVMLRKARKYLLRIRERLFFKNSTL